MKIYTKTGDSGSTGLYGGTRVSKADAQVEAYGNLDELNSVLAVCLSSMKSANIEKILQVVPQIKRIQHNLFTVGAEVATPKEKLILANGKNRLSEMLHSEEITMLETQIDSLEQELEPLQYFILPGGGEVASHFHVARTVCRRAERSLVFLNEQIALRKELLEYLNRLSDYFFVLSRYASKMMGEKEEYWKPGHAE